MEGRGAGGRVRWSKRESTIDHKMCRRFEKIRGHAFELKKKRANFGGRGTAVRTQYSDKEFPT